jgi:hypothetical protein
MRKESACIDGSAMPMRGKSPTYCQNTVARTKSSSYGSAMLMRGKSSTCRGCPAPNLRVSDPAHFIAAG